MECQMARHAGPFQAACFLRKYKNILGKRRLLSQDITLYNTINQPDSSSFLNRTRQ